MTLEQITHEAESLSVDEKTQLANLLLSQLHGPVGAEFEMAQIAFAHERLAAFESGEDTAEDADIVFERLRRKLKP